MNDYSFLNIEYYGQNQINKNELFDSKLDGDKSFKTKGNFVRHLKNYNYTFVEYCHEFHGNLVPKCLETGELTDNTIKGYYFGWYKIKKNFKDLKRKVNWQVRKLQRLADDGYEIDYLKHLYWIQEKGFSLSEAYTKINHILQSDKYKYLFDNHYDSSWTSVGIKRRKENVLNGEYEQLSPKFTLKGWIQRGWSEEKAQEKQKNYIDEYNYREKWGPDSENVVSPLKISYWIDKGFSESEAKKKVSNLQSERVQKRYEKYDEEERRKHIPSCVEYWTHRGYTEEEAKEEISELQSRTSLESFVERYGAVEGKNGFTKEIENGEKL